MIVYNTLMLSINFIKSKENKIFLAAIIPVVILVLFAAVYYVYDHDLGKKNEVTNENIDFQEDVMPITDFDTKKIEDLIADDNLSPIDKAAELSMAAALKISVGRYEEALMYKEAIYKLGVDKGVLLDQLLYEMVILSKKIDNNEKVKEYSDLLGSDKLKEYETIKEKVGERG